MPSLTATQAIAKGRFRVRIDDIPATISFRMCEGLKIGLEVGEYDDGTDTEKLLTVGNPVYDEVTLTAGESLATLQPLWDWIFACIDAKEAGGEVGEELKRTIDVECLDEAEIVKMTWRSSRCLPTGLEPDSRESGTADTALAKFSFKCQRRRPIWGSASG